LHRKAEWIKDGVALTVGSVLYAVSVNCFTAPNRIAPGGVTGLATAINAVTGFPIGLAALCFNVPLLLLALRFLGKRFALKTVIATVLMNLAIDALSFLPAYGGDKLLCCLYGGLLSGAATGLFFLIGGTGGGTDIVARLLRRKWKNLSAGRFLLLADGVVIVFASLLYRSAESGLYAVAVIFVSTTAVDRILLFGEGGKCFLIVTEKGEETAKNIAEKLARGVTVLSGRGYYRGEGKTVLLCSVRRNEANMLRKLVVSADAEAFAVALDASDVLGNGFQPWSE